MHQRMTAKTCERGRRTSFNLEGGIDDIFIIEFGSNRADESSCKLL